jgi:ParB family transcriptional regulator, chromosome partitioning protein
MAQSAIRRVVYTRVDVSIVVRNASVGQIMTPSDSSDNGTSHHDSTEPSIRSRERRRRSGLGRGLSALIPDTSTTEGGAIDTIPTSEIDPNPFQPRMSFDADGLEELVASIRTHGILQPVIVGRDDRGHRYHLIAGERRWRAAVLAGLESIPALVKEVSPQEMLELALVENVVRSDLSPIEEAIAYRQLIDEFGLTQLEVSQRVGRSRVSVTNTLRLLVAPDQVKESLQRGEISEGHARALLSLTSAADQIAMLERVVAQGMTVRQTESAVRAWLDAAPRKDARLRAQDENDPLLEDIQDRLRRTLSTRVHVRRRSGSRGEITIAFEDDGQLSEIVRRIAGDPLF